MAFQATVTLQSISLAIAAGFLLALPLQLRRLFRSATKRAGYGWHGAIKATLALFAATGPAAFSLTIITANAPFKRTILCSLISSVIADIGLGFLLVVHQRRSRRSSDLVVLYLLASVACDAVYLAMPSVKPQSTQYLRAVMFRCFSHTLLLVIECCGHRQNAYAFGQLQSQSAEDERNILDRTFFTWINPILIRGYKKPLDFDQIPPLCNHMRADSTRRRMIEAWSQRANPETKMSLPWALLKCLNQKFYEAIPSRLFLIVFRYSQPILIQETITYATAYSADEQSNRGYWLIVSAITIYTGLALSTAIYHSQLNKLKLMTRSALIGIIHHKMMLSKSVPYESGEATTLMSTDADGLDSIPEMLHETWAQIIEVAVGVALLASQVGRIWPLPLVLIYLSSHTSRFVAKNLKPKQKKWNEATQQRIAATSFFLSSMKIVKMLGLQQYLTKRIEDSRDSELSAAAGLRWVMVYYNASANALGIFSPAITLVLFAAISVAKGSSLDTATAFTTMAILSMITHPANMVMTIVPRAVASFAGFERIQTFLLRESLPAARGILSDASHNNPNPCAESDRQYKPPPAIRIRHLQIGSPQPTLENVNINIDTGSFNIISGPTGSGKSLLTRAILGEIISENGAIDISPRIRSMAYCSSKPWLTSGSIKEAICGMEVSCVDNDVSREQDAWYDEVIRLCCLEHDFKSFPLGDQTHIGSQGLNLSGGQRHRVALARALFVRCDVIVLDDFFSALDGETEKNIFDNLFGPNGALRRNDVTTILVSNSPQFFSAADHVVVLGDRGIVDQGRWKDLEIHTASVAKFSSHRAEKDGGSISASFNRLTTQLRIKEEAENDLSRQSGDTALYGYYLRFVNWTDFTFSVVDTFVYSIFITVPQYWLKLWTEAGGGSNAFYIGGFLFISFISWTLTSLQQWSVLIHLAPQTGARLHRLLLHTIASAPLSYFLETENGSNLNRFSQDMQLIDKQLPSAISTIITQLFKLIMQTILLCIAEARLVISLPICMVIVYAVQKLYLRTSRQLRLLELEARAYVFSSFLESIEGLETIRAFKWTEAAIQDNIRRVDESQRPEFLLLCLQRWLNLVLDLLVAGIAAAVVILAVAGNRAISGAQVGIALNIMLVSNKTLLKLVESWTLLETSLGAIARVRNLETLTPAEGRQIDTMAPPTSWPAQGSVDFNDITVSYRPGSTALRKLSLTISHGQKVVICGRTGSGKSTLLLTLLRLLELQSGNITLDCLDIRHVPLDILRQRCFITVPQDGLILPNETLRFNIDPELSADDELLIAALTKAGVWSHFCNNRLEVDEPPVPIDGGSYTHPILDQNMSAFQQLSEGQYQIFALCRTLVKGSTLRDAGIRPVVLLDELTSSVDAETETTIHRIIDEEFTANGHTVITIAHKLGNLENYMRSGRDLLVMLADGRLSETVDNFDKAALARFRDVE